jgi:hypothetical protein
VCVVTGGPDANTHYLQRGLRSVADLLTTRRLYHDFFQVGSILKLRLVINLNQELQWYLYRNQSIIDDIWGFLDKYKLAIMLELVKSKLVRFCILFNFTLIILIMVLHCGLRIIMNISYRAYVMVLLRLENCTASATPSTSTSSSLSSCEPCSPSHAMPCSSMGWITMI